LHYNHTLSKMTPTEYTRVCFHSDFDSDRLLHSQTDKICNICKIRRQDEDCYNFTDIANISLQCSRSSTGYQGQEMSRNKCFISSLGYVSLSGIVQRGAAKVLFLHHLWLTEKCKVKMQLAGSGSPLS
jgi:hypothetical protein